MKSTGIFGKNSGRVGGVVYSNYRGEQIVRAYQPKVHNPSTRKQVEQRAKFKLVSQVAASIGKELRMSFVPSVQKETSRNAFIKAMLKKTVYANNKAALPIEDIVLTNSSRNAFVVLRASDFQLEGQLTSDFSSNVKVRAVYIAYSSGGEIAIIGSLEEKPALDGSFGLLSPPAPQGYTNVRALVYAYEPDESNGATYQDYEILDEDATLNDVLKVFAGRINYSQTVNLAVPQNV